MVLACILQGIILKLESLYGQDKKPNKTKPPKANLLSQPCTLKKMISSFSNWLFTPPQGTCLNTIANLLHRPVGGCSGPAGVLLRQGQSPDCPASCHQPLHPVELVIGPGPGPGEYKRAVSSELHSGDHRPLGFSALELTVSIHSTVSRKCDTALNVFSF